MMHEPVISLNDEKTEECTLDADELLRIYQSIIKVYVQRTGKSPWQIAEDMRRDCFMSAEEAQAYGIVDMVSDSLSFISFLNREDEDKDV
jgi:ATP-dependent Clp protease protease subunit